MAGTTNTETCECGHDRALHEGGYWACSAEGCGCVMVSGAPDHPTPPAPEAGHAACAFPCPECDPEHATPPAPGEAHADDDGPAWSADVLAWAAEFLRELDGVVSDDCPMPTPLGATRALLARAAQAERERDELRDELDRAWQQIANTPLSEAETIASQALSDLHDARHQLTAATQDRDRLADALRVITDWIAGDGRSVEIEHEGQQVTVSLYEHWGATCRVGYEGATVVDALIAALAPRTRSTTTTPEET